MDVFYDTKQEMHDPKEPHVFGGESLPPAENASRARRLLSAFEHRFDIRSPGTLDMSLLLEVHSERYLDFLRTAHRRWRDLTGSPAEGEAVPYIRPVPGTPWKEPTSVLAQMGRFSFDVDPILSGTWEAILAGAACAASAASAALKGGSAYALTRPPGHHASREAYGGYCYLNNAAVAVQSIRRARERVAVLDLDAHHGNGTQSIFWERGDVLTVSIHGDPRIHYPFFLGFEDEVGEGAGVGRNLNLPLADGSEWSVYEGSLGRALEALGSFDPEAVVVSLGVDTHRAHGVLGLDDQDYFRIGEMVREVGKPTVFVQEGGYEPGTLEAAVPRVLEGFSS